MQKMKTRHEIKQALVIALLILQATGQNTATMAMAGSEEGWIFKQDSARYGRLTCYATPHNFRMDAMDLRLYVKAPFTRVSMYNMESKLRYQVPVDNVASRLAIRSLNERDKKAGTREVMTKIGQREICGFKCTAYRSDHVKKSGLRTPKVTIYATHDLKLPVQMETACAKLTDSPPGLGFPIRLQLYESHTDEASGVKGYKLSQILNTDKASRARVEDSTFDEPKGFRAARDETEVIMGDY